MFRCFASLSLFALLVAPSAPAQISSFPYFEGFEATGGGFAGGGAGSSWAWGAPTGPYINGAANGSRAWVTNLSGSYTQNEMSYLESPTFDFTALASDPFLQFSHIFQLDSSDESWVEISINGGPFTKLGQANDPGSVNWYNNTSNNWWNGNSGTAGEWRLARHAIDGGAGNMVKIRWVLQAFVFVGEDGIGVDDVAVFSSLRDVGVASLDTPTPGMQLTTAETVSVTLTNCGTTAESGFPVRYTVTGPTTATVTEIFGGPLPAVSTASFVFATPVDMSVPGVYTIQVSTLLAGDENAANDTVTEMITQQAVVTTFPYLQDFETGDGMFVEYGMNSSWAHGVPSGNFISGAGSGSNAWVTDLNGFHSQGEFSYLQAPPFDLTGFSNDPMLRFSHIFNIDFSDGSWVEVSLDGGPFTKLGRAGDPGSINWYNDTFNNWWDQSSGTAGAWRAAQHIIPGGAGKIVIVRWVLRSTQTFSLNEEGVGVDLVRVFEAPFGNGQVPQQGLATLDINNSFEAVGFPVSAGYPGPYFTSASASGAGTVDFEIKGQPNQPILLLGGQLRVGAFSFSGGQLDLDPWQLLASGIHPGGLNPFFVTNLAGEMRLSLTVPVTIIGAVSSFQAVVLGGRETFFVTNAVQVSFLP